MNLTFTMGNCSHYIYTALHRLYTANLGDCRAVLCRAGTAIDLTVDCKASRPEEVARIVEAGSFVNGGRVRGQQQVARALGDANHKTAANGNHAVCSVPELTQVCVTHRCSSLAYRS
jgi:serine/threonine protein phosphatase PrpC